MARDVIRVENLNAFSNERKILDHVNFHIEDKKVLSIIGPRGSGKSTLLRCLNRLFEERVGQRVEGQVYLENRNIYAESQDLLELRREVSMIFSEPTLFGHLSIFENVAIGLRLNNVESGAEIGEAVEKALQRVELWRDLKSKLHQSPERLGVGTRQLLCLARTLVMGPKVILMDEATSAVGLQKTIFFEQMIRETAKKAAIVMTTSSRKQAARISDRTAFLLDGELIEIGKTSDLFMNPKDNRTEDFLTGRFG